jgi:hypothetical protein
MISLSLSHTHIYSNSHTLSNTFSHSTHITRRPGPGARPVPARLGTHSQDTWATRRRRRRVGRPGRQGRLGGKRRGSSDEVPGSWNPGRRSRDNRGTECERIREFRGPAEPLHAQGLYKVFRGAQRCVHACMHTYMTGVTCNNEHSFTAGRRTALFCFSVAASIPACDRRLVARRLR